jgi:hypothetical protein
MRRLTTIDQVVSDPDEFRKLPDHDQGVIPWWPTMPPPQGLAATSNGGDSVLHEIEPDHWVGCWKTEHVAGHTCRRPDLDFRRQTP